MSIQQLHLVQCSYQRINACLQELTQITQENDLICLFADATLAIYEPQLQNFAKVLVLDSDAKLMNIKDISLNNIESITYTDLADYIVQADKVFTWR